MSRFTGEWHHLQVIKEGGGAWSEEITNGDVTFQAGSCLGLQTRNLFSLFPGHMMLCFISGSEICSQSIFVSCFSYLVIVMENLGRTFYLVIKFLLPRFALSAKNKKHTCTWGRDYSRFRRQFRQTAIFRVNCLAPREAHCRNLETSMNEQIELISGWGPFL